MRYKALFAVPAMLALLSGCESMQGSLERLDYVCIEGNLDGPLTESSGRGRGVKLPEGESLTPELAAALCP